MQPSRNFDDLKFSSTRAAPLVWSSVTADVGLIRNAVLTLIAKKQE